jgi:phospholipid/cholesterol/gamma-HCH transport system ATP-binding protein
MAAPSPTPIRGPGERPADDAARPRETGEPGAPRAAPRLRIQLRGLVKSFGPKLVLDHLDLDVADGESLVIVGGSGTGKSVTLKHVIGLIKPDAGSVVVDGVAIEQLDNRAITEFRRRFGMAFQEGALFDSMNVFDNVAFPLRRLSRKSSGEIRQRVDECLELVRLEGLGARDIAELSGGMRRRVGFARAIAHEPEILLFDEPTTGLDPVTTAQIAEVIREIRERSKTTMVTITHDMQVAFRVAHRIAMLFQGKIIAEAPPEEFKQLPDARVKQFIHGEAEGPLSDQPAAGGAARRGAGGFGR